MARCPFATWQPIGYNGGTYVAGPFRIVWHTTENSKIAAALAEFRAKPYASHFVVDENSIIQLIDTDLASRALQHIGSPETNRLSAVQIELVGFAGKPKGGALLAQAARLARWIETEHHIPQVWPNGFCKPPRHGKDPGGHNRNADTWVKQGGHYGHSNVPKNIHWDPAFTVDEIRIVTPDAFPKPEPQPERNDQ